VPNSKRSQRWILVSILGLYLLLAIGYGIVNPLFESPDEHWHYFTAQYIADNWELPAVTDDYDEWLSQEAAQPPLYYVLSALLIAPIDAENGRSDTIHNPFATIGDASYRTNINRFIHTEAESWPWQDFALAAHMLRLFSTLLGFGTLLCIFGSGRLIWPKRPEIALLATALVAFLPQFAFLHSSITNDALIVFLASFALWQLLRVWIDGGRNGRFLLLGITIGLAILTKTAGILLLIYSLGILFLLWLKTLDAKTQRHKENPQSLISKLLLILLPALLIGGWLWLRNWQLYGDITATEPFIRMAGGDRGYTLWQVISESDGLWASLFAIFGWFNLRPPDWVFWVWDGIVVAAIAGFVKEVLGWRLESKRPHINLQSLVSNLNQPWFIAVLLAIWVLGVYAGLVMFMMQTEAAQGRLLFPAILPLALVLAYGLSRFRWRWIDITSALLALTTSVYCLVFVVAPAYTVPPTITQLPETAVLLNTPLSDTLQLVGAEINTQTAVPDEHLTLTLYWQTTGTPADPSQFVVEMIGQDGDRIANLHSLHGRGLYPDTLWPENEIVADQFSILIDETAVSPVLAPVFVGLAGGGERVRIGDVKVEPETWPEAAASSVVQIGEGIVPTQVDLSTETAKPGDVVTLKVQWLVETAPGIDYTTLVHLAETEKPPLATADNQPLTGQYPTRVWADGEVINDQYQLLIPEGVQNGRYPIWLGMYDSETITRLPLTVDGKRQPNDVLLVGYIEISN
jgi:4-amino-4-deoxy-L-arabinose transferase-like glycosyltransferase